MGSSAQFIRYSSDILAYVTVNCKGPISAIVSLTLSSSTSSWMLKVPIGNDDDDNNDDMMIITDDNT